MRWKNANLQHDKCHNMWTAIHHLRRHRFPEIHRLTTNLELHNHDIRITSFASTGWVLLPRFYFYFVVHGKWHNNVL